MKFLNKFWFKSKNDSNNDPRLSYYDEEKNSIKFTKKTIYEYMSSSIGNDLDFYALNYFGTRISYGEMLKNIDSISKSLKYLGVKKGEIITICMPNTPEAVMTFYAINKIGAVADMIHPLSAPNEVKHYLNESKSRILFLYDANYEKYKNIIPNTYVYKTVLLSVSESMPLGLSIGYKVINFFKNSRIPRKDKKYIYWNEFINLHYHYNKKINNGGMSYKDLALILHSGGTTGSPKGIMIANANFNAEAQQGGIAVKKMQPKDKVMTILPIFHGFGLGVVTHLPLCMKYEVILIPEFNAKRFAKTIKEFKPNTIAGVPTLWEAMMSSEEFKDIDLSNLKYLISGGDHLTTLMEKKLNNFLHDHNANIKVYKGYGMTESVAAAAFTTDNANKLGSVGKPLIGNQFTICDPETEEILGPNKEGEICINGPTVMMGYLNNKEETNKVLKKHKDGLIWLHTKDAGYIDEDGLVYFTQRFKRVIVSSGYNVYPSAIEEVIVTHPKVKQCCVIGVPHPYKMQVAKAFVVLKDGVEPNIKIEAEIRILCKKNLSAFSIPKKIEFRSSLPKTLYNKIDYKQLEKESEEKK